jgi:hypothetical protein
MIEDNDLFITALNYLWAEFSTNFFQNAKNRGVYGTSP